MKPPKAKKREEQRTVFVLSWDGRYALEKRPNQGLLAGLYQFPNCDGWLEPNEAMAYLESQGLRPKELILQLQRQHIFTHIRWELRGYYVEVAAPAGEYLWLTEEEINTKAALPTAFRQFWEEIDHV